MALLMRRLILTLVGAAVSFASEAPALGHEPTPDGALASACQAQGNCGPDAAGEADEAAALLQITNHPHSANLQQVSDTGSPDVFSPQQVEVYDLDEVVSALPLAPASYPESLQGAFWLDQQGFYGDSTVPSKSALSDIIVSFGDPHHTLDEQSRHLWVNVTGAPWMWVSHFQGMLAFELFVNLHILWGFQFNQDYTFAQLEPSINASFLAGKNHTLAMQPSDPGSCPPKSTASKKERNRCASFIRHTVDTATGETQEYPAFRIADASGKPIEPYYSALKEAVGKMCSPFTWWPFWLKAMNTEVYEKHGCLFRGAGGLAPSTGL